MHCRGCRTDYGGDPGTVGSCPKCESAGEHIAEQETPTQRHMAYFMLNISHLARLLDLPEGAKVVRVSQPAGVFDALEVQVEHPDLPLAEEGLFLYRCNPHYETVEDDESVRIQFVSWGLPE